jgi:hypothetical protein
VGLGLVRNYWPVAVILLIQAGENRFLIIHRTGLALREYQIGQSLMWVFAIFLLWRLSALVLANYPSLEGFATRSLRYLVPFCLALGIGSFILYPRADPGLRPVEVTVSGALSRAAAISAVSYLLALGVFTGWFPVRMSRNAARLLIGFMAVFAAEGLSALASGYIPKEAGLINGVLGLVWLTVVAYWLVTLNRRGEEEVVHSPVPAWNPARLARTTQQLDQITVELSRRGL